MGSKFDVTRSSADEEQEKWLVVAMRDKNHVKVHQQLGWMVLICSQILVRIGGNVDEGPKSTLVALS